MADSPSTERARTRLPGRFEQLAALGIVVCLAGLPLPWYRVRFDSNLTQSGLAGFGFGQGALLITLAAAGFLIFRTVTGRRPPLPLHVGTLLAVAGGWAAVIVAILSFDRPSTTIQGLRIDYGLSYGAIVSFAGAITLLVAGVRHRSIELRRRAGPSPSAASPPRSAS
jgi:hypothetical protein